uniref:Uncharacterized protein n=1 Tax=Anguilla anguilla TaxID=7936 RepID=A0A0E9RX76_ANGAN
MAHSCWTKKSKKCLVFSLFCSDSVVSPIVPQDVYYARKKFGFD